jgi:3-dehydroquinate synthase
MKQINSYKSTVFIGNDVFDCFKSIINNEFKYVSKIFILVDSNTIQYCLPLFIDNIPALSNAEVLEVDNGEPSKSFEILSGLIEAMASMNADKNTLLINLGGGVVSDLGGLLAALYKRGIIYINVPTSLLAMADASVGGKVAVNVNNIKNIAGVFYPPKYVFINPVFLQTLSEQDYLSGYAEMLKHALLDCNEHWQKLTSCNLFLIENWDELLFKSVNIKNRIVINDPQENNERKLLNLGHTVAHAIEALFLSKQYLLTHGEAVAAGILIEALLNFNRGNLKLDDLNSIKKVVLQLYTKLPVSISDIDTLIAYMQNDKKNENDEISFVLLSEIGNAHINKTASIDEIKAALINYISLT